MGKGYQGSTGIGPWLGRHASALSNVNLAAADPISRALAQFNGAMHTPNLPPAAPNPGWWQRNRQFDTQRNIPPKLLPIWAYKGVPKQQPQATQIQGSQTVAMKALAAAMAQSAQAIQQARG